MSDHSIPEGDPGEYESHVPTYITVLLTLTVLTVIEVFIPEVYASEWNQNTKMLLLVILAVAKALLVAWFFMHLKYERPWLRWIAAMPVYMAIFAIIIMLETLYRGAGGIQG